MGQSDVENAMEQAACARIAGRMEGTNRRGKSSLSRYKIALFGKLIPSKDSGGPKEFLHETRHPEKPRGRRPWISR